MCHHALYGQPSIGSCHHIISFYLLFGTASLPAVWLAFFFFVFSGGSGPGLQCEESATPVRSRSRIQDPGKSRKSPVEKEC